MATTPPAAGTSYVEHTKGAPTIDSIYKNKGKRLARNEAFAFGRKLAVDNEVDAGELDLRNHDRPKRGMK